MPIPNTQNYYAQPNPIYQPAMRNILSITQDAQALVTTTFDGVTPGDHLYETGLIVRIRVPFGFGMTQIDELSSQITVVNSTQFTLDTIDSTNFDPFIIPTLQPGNLGTPAQVVPTGENTDMLTQAVRNTLRR